MRMALPSPSASSIPTVEYDLRDYPQQANFVRDSARFCAFIGGIGAGKTYGGALKALQWLLAWGDRPSVGLVVAPTYRMLADATLRTYQDVLRFTPAMFRKSDMMVYWGKAQILFRSADEPEHLRGPNTHWAHIDESALCARETFDIVIGRVRADGTAGPVWLTTTPKGRNWVYDRVRDGTLKVYRARTEDNPHTSTEFKDSLRRVYTGQFAAQELDAEFVAFEGLVYDEFRRDVHIRERDKSEFQRFIIGVDEGYTNPAVALVIGVDGDGRVHVIEEFYQRRVLQESFVEEIGRLAQVYDVEAVYVDPSAAGLIAALRSAGVPTRAARNDLRQGIQAVKARLAVAGDGGPRLTAAPRCAQLIAEFEMYVWAKDHRGIVTDKPEKQTDHAMDALRYGVMALDWGRPKLQTMPSLYA